jgi:hypothetical protein
VRIYQVAPADSDFPTGSLVPIAQVPGFDNEKQALDFIKGSQDKLARMQLMIVKGLQILAVQVETTTNVVLNVKPKVLVK